MRYPIPQGWGTFFYGKRKYSKADHSFGLLSVIRISASMRVSAAGTGAAGAIASYASAASFKYNVTLTLH
jgi:hypothetical protein